jgi:hypothetical protein
MDDAYYDREHSVTRADFLLMSQIFPTMHRVAQFATNDHYKRRAMCELDALKLRFLTTVPLSDKESQEGALDFYRGVHFCKTWADLQGLMDKVENPLFCCGEHAIKLYWQLRRCAKDIDLFEDHDDYIQVSA